MLNKSSFHLPVQNGTRTYCSKLQDIWMQMKTRIQVKGEFLEVSTSMCLWITSQARVSIKPTSPPSVLIPDLFSPWWVISCPVWPSLFFMQWHTEMLSDLSWRMLSWTQIFGSCSMLYLFLQLTPWSYFSPHMWFLSCESLPVVICVAENWDQRWIEEGEA